MASRKESFKELYREVSEIYYRLEVACTDKVCNELLDNLLKLIQTQREAVDDIEVKRCMTMLSDTMIYQRQTDVGLSQVKGRILELLDSIDKVIAAEDLAENSAKLRKLFLALAEHSDELAKIDFDEVFS